ncbi:MAG: methylated-DNA--[protein]-cysteine S-methyltransferase [Gemmatimonadales bacterium]|nr:MAG: methylated-DNA--[protein]-cysteine S-methyltransferase [Gemmatimonadales bacterium]
MIARASSIGSLHARGRGTYTGAVGRPDPASRGHLPCPRVDWAGEKHMRIEWTSYQSPVGVLTILEAREGPLIVEFAERTGRLHLAERLRQHAPGVVIDTGPCRQATSWLTAYFAGRPRPFPYPDYLTSYLSVSDSQAAVWRALTSIPFGETRSYEDIATATGIHPRAVGQLNGSNHLAILLPCHRVVGKDGGLVGYGGGLETKAWLLDHELRSVGLTLSAPPAY